MKNDPRSCERNLYNCVRSLKKIQDFDGIWTPDLSIPVQRSNQLSYEVTDVVACSRRLDSGEQVKSYAPSAKRNTRGKNEGRLGRERETPPPFFPPYFFPRKFFAGALIFCPLPTIRTPGTGYWCWELVNYMFMHCVHNCKDHSSFDSISVVLIILYNLFHIHLSHKNNVRTNSKENTSRLLMTLKI